MLEKEVITTLSKEELQEAVETLQAKLQIAEKEIENLKELAEVGKKYSQHLKTEAIRLTRLVEGENSPLLRLLEKADIDTLKSIVDEYTEKAKEKYKPSAIAVQKENETELTAETLLKADYKTLAQLSQKFYKEVK